MPLLDAGTFSVPYLQVLDEHGQVDAALDPHLPEAELHRLYRGMVLAREADQRMLKLQRQGRIGTFALCTGQEAAVCGAALAMGEKDWLAPAFRELGAWLMRGMPLWKTFLYYNGREEGNVMEHSDRDLPHAVIVASQLLHAVGIGYALRYRGETDSAVVTVFGDGATSQGDFHEALNFASVWQAPVVFLCQNNHWAISVPRSAQTHSRTLAQKAIAYDIPGIQVDGNDALAVYRATREALDRAHSGGGPTLIEAVTYRLMMHTTADDPTRYRSEDEVKAWWEKDPLVRMRIYLEARGLWDAARQAALEAEVAAEISAAVEVFEQFPAAEPEDPFEHVYGTRHAGLEAQRAELRARLGKD